MINSSKSTLVVKSVILSIFVFFIFTGNSIFGLTNLHVSLAVNYEVSESYWSGYDFTMIFNQAWGFRYTNIPNFQFVDNAGPETDANSVSLISYKGTLEMPMVLRTIDFKAFENSNRSALDFITAYVAVGFNNINAELTRQEFSAVPDSIVKKSITQKTNAPTYACAFGLYAGEKFLFVDSRVFYLKGKTEKTSLFSQETEFEHWLLIVSLGIGF